MIPVNAGCRTIRPNDSGEMVQWKPTKESPKKLPPASAVSEIEQYAAILKQNGRMPSDFNFASNVLGRYGWHATSGGGYEGRYTFFQPAFDQAMRSWWVNAVMEGGSDVLRPVFSTAEFDDSVIGHHVGRIYMAESESFLKDAVVVGLASHGGLRLNQTAPHFAMSHGISILPPDYVDMCNCYASNWGDVK